MDLPSTRELELETLLRERDAQVIQLTDEVAHLRHYLSNQPAPSTTEPITLPPPLLSLLLPHINNAQRAATVTGASGTGSTTSSVNTALLQRAKLLQEENDELYELLKHGEVSKINEEVRALRRVVQKLETALKESHKVIVSLSTELDKSNSALLSSAPAAGSSQTSKLSVRPSNAQWPSRTPQNGVHSPTEPAKPIPTGPRAPKKPRLAAPERDRDAVPHTSSVGTGAESIASGGSGGGGSGGGGARRAGGRDRDRDRGRDRKHSRSKSPRPRGGGKDGRGADADGHSQRARSPKPSREGDKQHQRDRNPKDREREGHRSRRRGGRTRPREHSPGDLDDRTLASRMGVH